MESRLQKPGSMLLCLQREYNVDSTSGNVNRDAETEKLQKVYVVGIVDSLALNVASVASQSVSSFRVTRG